MGSNPEPDISFTNLVRRAYDKNMVELFEHGEAVERLLAHPGFEIVASLVQREIDQVDQTLNGQLLATRAEYGRLTGRRAGLAGFEAAAVALVAKANDTRAEQERKHEAAAGSVG